MSKVEQGVKWRQIEGYIKECRDMMNQLNMAVSLLIRNGYLPEEIGEEVVDVSSQLHAALQMQREDKPDMRSVADKVIEAYAKFVVVRSELEREHKEAVKCVKSNRKLPAGYDTLEVYMRYIASKFTVLRGMASRVD